MGTVQELAEAAQLTITDAKIATERLVLHGELLRDRRVCYARPNREIEGL